MRFGLVQKIEDIALDLLDHLIEAIYRRDRHVLYPAVNIRLEKLRIFLRLSHDRGLLGADQLRFAVAEIDQIGRMWHGWTGKPPRVEKQSAPEVHQDARGSN
jgi:hypothetical protein